MLNSGLYHKEGDLLDAGWQRLVFAARDQLIEQQALELEKIRSNRLLHLLPMLTEDSFKLCDKQEQEAWIEIYDMLTGQRLDKDMSEAQGKAATSMWERAYGDLSSPEVRERLDRAAEAMQALRASYKKQGRR